MADTAMHRIYNLINGAVWAAIPKWAYITFAIAILAAGGFGYGFFYQLNENSKLKDVEWLYRYERLWWKGKEQEDLLRREKIFAVGTQQEQDSVKNRIRQYEKARHIEDTFSISIHQRNNEYRLTAQPPDYWKPGGFYNINLYGVVLNMASYPISVK